MTAAAYEPTLGDVARDRITATVGNAYGLLMSETRAQLTAFLAGPRNPVAAYEVAQVIVATTPDADLAAVLARLLVMTDDQVMGFAVVTQCSEAAHPSRRASDKVEG